ncbi:MAG: transcription elongation factor GreA [marine bacterium B5-7]|nr:MAG: transcription elongation factor GreA [marine bacterium B5-7]
MERIPLTVYGAEKLKDELEHRKRVERPAIIKAIAEAREHGDLKENAEYHAAREQQSFAEGRIQDLEGKLSLAQVIDVTKMENNGRVIFGATVHLIRLDDDAEVKYQIVGADEASVEHNKISYQSPIARGLIGKEEGESVNIQAPGGEVAYEIAEVEYV